MELELFLGIPLLEELYSEWISCEQFLKNNYFQIDAELFEITFQDTLYFAKKLEKIVPVAQLDVAEAHLKSILMQILPHFNAAIPAAKIFATSIL